MGTASEPEEHRVEAWGNRRLIHIDKNLGPGRVMCISALMDS